MAADPFKIKAHDTRPSIGATLGFAGSSAVPNLTDGSTVTFIMRVKGSAGAPKVQTVATIVDAATAKVRYDWTSADTDTPGEYDAEWEVLSPDGGVQTFPTDGYNAVLIYADLDNS